eukprot:GHVP01033256.1.p1 GENE.GHVP01033256.1~~GHVP01033256.1.p1  ORF type:complete len:164 (-),score=26.16 GHVP01033256.1:608-1099(-)
MKKWPGSELLDFNGSGILVFDELASTQLFAIENFESLLETQLPGDGWFAVVAKKQSRGIGQVIEGFKRTRWEGGSGNIAVSFLKKLPHKDIDYEKLSLIPLVVSYSICHVLGNLYSEKDAFSSSGPKMKWINDVLINQKKVSGCICDFRKNEKYGCLIIGIGS